MRHFATYLLVPAFALGVGACGQQKKHKETVYDYYIEDGEFEGSGTTPTPNSGDAEKQTDTRLHFTSPAADVTTDGVVSVVVALTGVEAEATWSLYYAKTATATDGIEIAKDLPSTQTTVDWDTAAIDAGVYYLYATLTGTKPGRSDAGFKITVSADAPDDSPAANKKPTLNLDFPIGENVFVAGEPQAIKVTAADADGDDLKFKIEYSPDGGTTWTQLAADVTEPTYDWDVAGLAQGINYRVRVTADDGNGGTVQAQSAKSFGVATTPMTFAAGFGAMLTSKCGGCHAAGRVNQAQFRSDNFDLATIGVDDKKANIKNRIDAGTMPPAGALGAADKAILTMWIWGGNQ